MRIHPASRLRRILTVVAAASIGFVPAVLVATPAQADPGDIAIDADLEQAEGDVFTFELRRTGGPGLQALTLKYDTLVGDAPAADVSNGSTSDLTRLYGTTTFAASTRDVVKRFSVVTKDDTLNEDPENFILEFRDNDSNTLVAQAFGIIDDNDTKPVYSLNATDPMAEDAGNVTVTASLNVASGRTVTIPYTTSPGTATADDDYASSGGNIVIPPGETVKTTTIAVVDDTLDENDETFSVVGGDAPNATKGTVTSKVVNITDSDLPPVVSIAAPGNTVESNSMTFPVSLSAISGKDVTVRVTSSDGTAMAGADYTPYDQDVTIHAGDQTENVVVNTSADPFDEVDPETFTMTLGATPTNGTRSIPNGSATGNITDDDTAPVATLAPANVPEGTTGSVNQDFTVTLDAASGQPVKIGYTVSGSTATEGVDFEAVQAGELTFNPGDLVKKITVPIIGDKIDEGNGEDFVITLSNSAGTVDANSSLGPNTITIDDDDNQPVLQAVSSITRAEDAAGPANFDVKVSNPSSQPISVDVTTADLSTDSTPGTFHDFDPIPGNTTVVIPAGQDHIIVPVTVLADDVFEGDETATFSAALTAGEMDATGTSPDATLTLTNDDDPPSVALRQASAAEGSSVQLMADVTGVAQADIAVDVALTGGAGDPADMGDFSPTSLNATILGGANATATVNLGQVDFADDTIDENNETVLATLSDQGGDIANATATLTIQDDANDVPPTFEVGDQTFGEGDGTVDIPVDLVFAAANPQTTATERTLSVHYATDDGTATEDDDDYDGTSGTLTFAPGDPMTKNIQVDIEDDLAFEANETFEVKLSAPTPNGVAAITRATGTITITDDDTGNKPIFTVSAPAGPVTEASGTVNVTINVSPKTTQDIDFVVSAEADQATSGQAGPGGSDYTVGTTAKVLAGTTSITVPVTINNDPVYEGSETATIKVALGNSETDATGPDKTTTFAIADNDAVPTMTLNVTGGGEGTQVAVTGTVTGVAQYAVPITVAAAGMTNGPGTYAAGVNDFDATGLAVTQIPAGDQTGAPLALGTIDLATDQIDEYTETVRVGLSVNSGPTSYAYLTITDDALDMTPTIGIADVTVSEAGPNATVVASLDFSAQNNDAISTEKTLGAHWATADGTAKVADNDYTASSGDISFTGGVATRNINVPINDDALYELTEDFLVNLTLPTGTTLSDASATVSITDNDGSNKPGFTVTGPVTYEEGSGTLEYTVTMSPKNTQAVDFTVDLQPGTATQDANVAGGDDFATPTGTLTIPANAITGKIQLTIKDDDVFEPTETATLNVALAQGETNASGPAVLKAITITDDDTAPTVALLGESGGEGTDLLVKARTIGVAQNSTTFALAFSGDASNGGNAAETSDYQDNHDTATIPAGTPDGTLLDFRVFRLNNDTIDEPIETLKVVATNAGNNVASDPQYYKITDDPNDVPPSVTVGDLTVGEATTPAQVPVTLSFPQSTDTTATEQTIVVNLATGDDSATSPSDYTPQAGAVTFLPNVTARTFSVPIVNDQRYEDDETFLVTVTSATPAGTPTAQSVGTVTIDDNDENVARPGFSVEAVSRPEGNAANTATFTVTLDSQAADAVSFTVGAEDGTAWDTGSGAGSNDYNPPVSSTLTIGQGSTTGQFTIPVNGDAVYEDDETLAVNVALAVGELDAVGGPENTSLTLENDDAKPVVVLSNGSGTEGDQIALAGTVSGSTQNATDAEVNIYGDTATEEDYNTDEVTLEGVIPAGAVTGTPVNLGAITLNEDTIDEPTETVKAQSGTRTTTYRIFDDPDDLPPTLSIGDATIGENEESVDLVLQLTFSGDTTAAGYNVSVPWYTANDTARAGSDYTASEGYAMIEAGSDSTVVNVPIGNDSLYEGDQTFSVGVNGSDVTPTVVKTTRDTATVTIIDDEEPTAPTLTAAASRVGSGPVTVSGTAGEDAKVVLYAAPLNTPTTYTVMGTTFANAQGNYSLATKTLAVGTRLYTLANGLKSPVRLVQLGQAPKIAAVTGAKGVVTLNVAGNPTAATQAVQFQQLVGSQWRTVAQSRIGVAGAGRASAVIRNLRTGTSYSFRAVLPATPSLGILEGTTPIVKAIPR